MDLFDRPLFFKHLYGTTVNNWGLIAFPKNQPASAAARIYQAFSPVLLAIPQSPQISKDRPDYPHGYEGTIFGVCTLLPIADATTRQIANPEWADRYPEDVEKWDTALPIHEMWEFERSIPYKALANGTLTRLAQTHIGHLISLKNNDRLCQELHKRVSMTVREQVEVYRSVRASNYLERWQS